MHLQPRHLGVTVIGAMNTASVFLHGSDILRSTVTLGGCGVECIKNCKYRWRP